jgi:hypothetical protein
MTQPPRAFGLLLFLALITGVAFAATSTAVLAVDGMT